MSERKLSVTITGPEGMLEAMANLLRGEGYSVTSPADHAEAVRLGRQFWAEVDAGLGCPVHDGKVHGGEAEELRAGLERMIAVGGVVPRAVQRLLDETDARDSLAHGEALDRARARIAELEAQLACRHHPPDACCTLCIDTTDGLGFPHPTPAGERRRLQRCRACGKWTEPANWTHDIKGVRFGCKRCFPSARRSR